MAVGGDSRTDIQVAKAVTERGIHARSFAAPTGSISAEDLENAGAGLVVQSLAETEKIFTYFDTWSLHHPSDVPDESLTPAIAWEGVKLALANRSPRGVIRYLLIIAGLYFTYIKKYGCSLKALREYWDLEIASVDPKTRERNRDTDAYLYLKERAAKRRHFFARWLVNETDIHESGHMHGLNDRQILLRDIIYGKAYRRLIKNHQRLAGIDAVIADFDGVDKDSKLEVVPEEIVMAKKKLSERKVWNITITGESYEVFVRKYGGNKRIGQVSVNKDKPYVALISSGAVGKFVNNKGEFQEISGFETVELGDKDTVNAIEKVARNMLSHAAREAGIPNDVVDRIRITASPRGVTIYVEDDERIRAIRFSIAELVRNEINRRLKDRVSGKAEVVASYGGVDVMPTSKGASAIQMIKLLHLTRVVLIADSLGTKENPGNDRSLLALTQEDLHKAGINWGIDLIKIYVGREENPEIPEGVIVAPQGKKETDPALKIYKAIIEAKDRGVKLVVTQANRLKKRFLKHRSPAAEAEIKAFSAQVIKKALDLEDPNAAKSLQVVARQLLNTILYIQDGIGGAAAMEVTADENEMLKHPVGADTKRKYPLGSFLKINTLPTRPTDKESTPGFYWRGYEGPEKLKDMAEKGLCLTQLASTGVGHFQGNTLDFKFLPERVQGKLIQFNVRYNIDGSIQEVLRQDILPGQWGLALPGYVDYAVNVGGVDFYDFSVILSDAEARQISPNFDFSQKEAVAKVVENLRVAPYSVVCAEIGYLADNEVYYIMNHGIIPVPAALVAHTGKGQISTLHHTAFVNNTVTGLPVKGELMLKRNTADAPPIKWIVGPSAALFGDSDLIEVYRGLNAARLKKLVSRIALNISPITSEVGAEFKAPVLPVISPEQAQQMVRQMAAIQAYRNNPKPLRLNCKSMTSTDGEGYSWGDGGEGAYPGFIPALLGIPNPAHKPHAEHWIGAHPSAPAKVMLGDTEVRLDDLVSGAALEILGREIAERFNSKLPYLMKVLTAARPLSIQAHPNKQQAEDGWLRQGNKPGDNYKDDNHKPEICCALTEFWALNGFRPIAEIIRQFEQLDIPELRSALADFRRGVASDAKAALKAFYSFIMRLSPEDMDNVVRQMTDRAQLMSKNLDFLNSWEDWVLRCKEACIINIDEAIKAGKIKSEEREEKIRKSLRGIPSIYLLNLVCLKPGQAMYLPAGELHAYLRGAIIEVMATSDNVLRGGMTHKHMDVDELLRVLTFNSGKPTILTPQHKRPAEKAYSTPAPEFEVSVIDVSQAQTYTSDARHSAEALIVLEGEVVIVDSNANRLEVRKGNTIIVPAASGTYSIRAATGTAKLYKASVPLFAAELRGEVKPFNRNCLHEQEEVLAEELMNDAELVAATMIFDRVNNKKVRAWPILMFNQRVGVTADELFVEDVPEPVNIGGVIYYLYHLSRQRTNTPLSSIKKPNAYLGAEKEKLDITDIGTVGTHNMEYRDKFTSPRIRYDIESAQRFVRIVYIDGKFEIDSDGNLRASQTMVNTGSTGPNAGRILATHGAQIQLFGFSGGFHQDVFSSCLSQNHIGGLMPLEGNGRVSLFLFTPDEIPFRGMNPELSAEQAALIVEKICDSLRSIPAERISNTFVIFGGQVFPGMPVNCYTEAIRKLRDMG